MEVCAALLTGRGVGAISSIGVFGDGAERVLRKIFKPTSGMALSFEPGRILLGQIDSDGEVIDQVTVGCEGENNFAINCHGNPLIVEMIMEVLSKRGVRLITAGRFMANVLATERKYNTIAIEARVEQTRAKTIEGTKIIAEQIEAGLNETARRWLKDIQDVSIDVIQAEAEKILKATDRARLIIAGCVVVLAGPANSGKSTLLNCLCGRDKAIVTEIKGTTRDWVSARSRMGPLAVELIDTAGFWSESTAENAIEKESQRRSIEILERADLILLVLDAGIGAEQLDYRLVKKTTDKKILVALNKSDLPTKFDIEDLKPHLTDVVRISAKFERGIDELKEKLLRIMGVADFDKETPVCFTIRQQKLLKQLCKTKSKSQARSVITELLNGDLN